VFKTTENTYINLRLLLARLCSALRSYFVLGRLVVVSSFVKAKLLSRLGDRLDAALVFTLSTTFPLVVECLEFLQTFFFLSFAVNCPCYKFIDNSILSGKLLFLRGPLNLSLVSLCHIRVHYHFLVVAMVHLVYFTGNFFWARFLNTALFKDVFGATSVLAVSQKHFVVDSPIFVTLLE
jgi:hypothetical protein